LRFSKKNCNSQQENYWDLLNEMKAQVILYYLRKTPVDVEGFRFSLHQLTSPNEDRLDEQLHREMKYLADSIEQAHDDPSQCCAVLDETMNRHSPSYLKHLFKTFIRKMKSEFVPLLKQMQDSRDLQTWLKKQKQSDAKSQKDKGVTQAEELLEDLQVVKKEMESAGRYFQHLMNLFDKEADNHDRSMELEEELQISEKPSKKQKKANINSRISNIEEDAEMDEELTKKHKRKSNNLENRVDEELEKFAEPKQKIKSKTTSTVRKFEEEEVSDPNDINPYKFKIARPIVSSGRTRKRWNEIEVEMLVRGIVKFGIGHWKDITDFYDFGDRTPADLKDKWRNLEKDQVECARRLKEERKRSRNQNKTRKSLP